MPQTSGHMDGHREPDKNTTRGGECQVDGDALVVAFEAFVYRYL